MRRIAALAALALVAAGCSGHHNRTLGGYGVSLALPHGWYGLAAPGQLQAADFPLRRSVLASAERARVGRGHVHLIVWDTGPAVSYLGRSHPPARAPLRFRRRDVTPAPLEGFPSNHAFALRSVDFGGELLEVVADLGPKPLAASRLGAANRVVASLKVSPARVISPRGGVLARDGVSLRLPLGWSGQIEVPASTYFTKFVLRARRGVTRVALLDLSRSVGAPRVHLPIVLVRRSRTFARSVVEANGHTFDLSAVFASSSGRNEAQRLVSRLRVSPVSR